jgi:hypothetical protein
MALQAKATNLAVKAMDEKRDAESKLATVRRHPDCVAIMCGATECSSTGAYPCYVNVPASAPLEEEVPPCIVERIDRDTLRCHTHDVTFSGINEPPPSCAETIWTTPDVPSRQPET